jgi:ribonuclease H2 subunit C
MLAVKAEKPSEETAKATPHLLPCRVHHSGSVEPVQSFWEPKVGSGKDKKRHLIHLESNPANHLADGTRTAYFRGRKLQGTAVKLPEGYRGVVAVASAPEERSRRPEEAEVIDLEAGMPQGSLQVQAEFDEMVVWGHETAVDAGADPHLRAAEEWLALAEKVGPDRFDLLFHACAADIDPTRSTHILHRLPKTSEDKLVLEVPIPMQHPPPSTGPTTAEDMVPGSFCIQE